MSSLTQSVFCIDGIEETKTGQNKGYIPIKNLILKEYKDAGSNQCLKHLGPERRSSHEK